uniref:Microfibril associated protein 2 n=1 Tax=Scleropages formosus TaxID=113540 RepID=A0A8C9V2W0_SCLFO
MRTGSVRSNTTKSGIITYGRYVKVSGDQILLPLPEHKVNCREEQYPCTRLYSVHKPCRQCLNSLCFYSLRRVYVVNKEVCVRTVCAHEELLRGEHATS